MNMNIKAIAFDAYGTLFDVHSVIEKCEELYPNKGEEISHLWRDKQLEYTWLRSLMGKYRNFWWITEDALIYSLKHLELDWNDDIIASLLNEYLHLQAHAEIPEALEALKDKVKLAILSNGSPNMLHDMVRNANMDDVFTEVISVDEVKMFKPYMGVYQLGSEKLNLPKDKMLFVSSNPFDIAGAKVYGYQVCWINRFNLQAEEFNDLDSKPDVITQSLVDLVKII